MESVPPRGSGWVRNLKIYETPSCVPTRHREVALTPSRSKIQGTKFSQATLKHSELSNRAKKYFLKNFLTGHGPLPYKTALAQNASQRDEVNQT
jgi:hypothetical protein